MDSFANLTVEIAEAKKLEPTVLSCSFSFNGNQATLFLLSESLFVGQSGLLRSS